MLIYNWAVKVKKSHLLSYAPQLQKAVIGNEIPESHAPSNSGGVNENNTTILFAMNSH